MRKSLILFLMLLLCAVSFTACGEPESTEADYKVTVADANGNPISTGYAVRFMQNGQQVAMQIPNEQGESIKTMLKGDYQVELQFTGSDVQYHYDSSDLTLSAEKTQLDIVLAYALPEESRELFVGNGNVAAYAVNEGTTYIQLDSEKRSYYLFTPTRPGMYEFSLANSTAAIGYYGAPHYVQEYSAVEVVDNKFSLSVSADNIGTGNTI